MLRIELLKVRWTRVLSIIFLLPSLEDCMVLVLLGA